jgi:hypothetical protein
MEERHKALAKENITLKTQLDYLEWKVRKGAEFGGSSIISSKARRGAMTTPKPSSKFLDDTAVNYSSPNSENELDFTRPLDNLTFRRQIDDTIRSFRTGAADSTLSGASAAGKLSQQTAEVSIYAEKILPFEQ